MRIACSDQSTAIAPSNSALRVSIVSMRPTGGAWKAKSMTLVFPPRAAAKE